MGKVVFLIPLESPDGLWGIFGLVVTGEGGRLEKLLLVGVIGVLDGRSIGTVKLRKDVRGDGDGSPLRSTPPLVFGEDVGTEGREKAGCSSSSSIDGNA